MIALVIVKDVKLVTAKIALALTVLVTIVTVSNDNKTSLDFIF